MNEVIVREANLQDCRELGAVSSQAYRDTYNEIIPEDYIQTISSEERQKYFQKTMQNTNKLIWILFVNNKAIGYMEVGNCTDLDAQDHQAEIFSLYSLKKYWGNGYGKRLVTCGTRRLREIGYFQVSLWVLKENMNARSFYEHMGFTNDGTERTIIRGAELIQVRYNMQL